MPERFVILRVPQTAGYLPCSGVLELTGLWDVLTLIISLQGEYSKVAGKQPGGAGCQELSARQSITSKYDAEPQKLSVRACGPSKARCGAKLLYMPARIV